ncbi:MAG: peptidoglycan-binding protein, partial [Elusimicrobiota bacterium]
VNAESRLAVLRADDLTKETEISVDSFPVGLAVSPDGRWVWVTSQGRSLRGGNSVSIYEIGFPMAR